MTMIIAKTFEFEAAHKLPEEECYGACSNLHGHTYKLTVEISGKVNDKGWVMNFKELKQIVKEVVLDKYDHSNLNDFFAVPTAENMLLRIGLDIHDKLPFTIKVHSITLWETSTSYAKITY